MSIFKKNFINKLNYLLTIFYLLKFYQINIVLNLLKFLFFIF